MKIDPEEICKFWLEDVGPKGWYEQSDALDQEIRSRYLSVWEYAASGEADELRCNPEGTLALLIILDQFPRNMFRGDGQSFATDAMALGLAKKAIGLGHDLKTELPARQFYYMPLMHSENISDQEQCVRLVKMNLEGSGTLRHAKAHRAVIRQFGRFPARNEALGRSSAAVEQEYLAQGGYAKTMREIPE